MRIYLAGPIVSGHDASTAIQLVEHIQENHIITNPGIIDPASADRDRTPQEIFSTAQRDLLSAEAMIAEVTRPSHGVGYELGVAASQEIRALCLYQTADEANLSMMIVGSPHLETAPYRDMNEAEEAIDAFLAAITNG